MRHLLRTNIHFNRSQDSLGRLQELAILDCSNNRLQALPKSVCQLLNLQYLSLKHNSLRILPFNLGFATSLTSLYLDDNELIALPPTLGYCTRLKLLTCCRNILEVFAEFGGATRVPFVFLIVIGGYLSKKRLYAH